MIENLLNAKDAEIAELKAKIARYEHALMILSNTNDKDLSLYTINVASHALRNGE